MSSSLSDILSALKNGVIAINNLVAAYSYSLFAQAAIPTSAAVYFTCPAANTAYIADICICNTTASAITVSMFLVPSGAAAGTSNALFYNMSVPADTTYHWTGIQVLNGAGTIQLSASATGCTATISGRIK